MRMKHLLIPSDLRDTPFDEANQNNWAWPEAQMKRNCRATYRTRLVTHVGLTLAAALLLFGFLAQAFVSTVN